jgi:hypothetical protein
MERPNIIIRLATALAAQLAYYFLRLFLLLPDSVIRFKLISVYRLASLLGADSFLLQVIHEVYEIFTMGPRATSLVRRMFTSYDKEFLTAVIRGSILGTK